MMLQAYPKFVSNAAEKSTWASRADQGNGAARSIRRKKVQESRLSRQFRQPPGIRFFVTKAHHKTGSNGAEKST
jgi:hypothetical protein